MKVFLLLLTYFFWTNLLLAGPFPVKGDISDGKNQKIGKAHVYPQYVEIFNNQKKMLGKVGIMTENGLAKLFLVKNNQELQLVGHTERGLLYNKQNQVVGKLVWTPTYSFIYDLQGKRVGKVKCIAWPRVCAAGVAGYLLKLF